MSDSINPDHYKKPDGAYETIKVIEAWGLGFCLGNVLKYISRAGKKGDRIEDLKKARWYLDREISRSVVHEPPKGVWIEHTGDECPVAPDTMVRIRMRKGGENKIYCRAEDCWWETGESNSITHYMIQT